jgi:hypothetical protein
VRRPYTLPAIPIPARLGRPHPLVAATQRVLHKASPDHRQLLGLRSVGGLDIYVSPAAIPRALRLMNALLKALEARGWAVAIEPAECGRTFVEVLGTRIRFHLEEMLASRAREEPELNQWQYIRRHGHGRAISWGYDRWPSSRFVLKAEGSWYVPKLRCVWREGPRQTPEAMLGLFVKDVRAIAGFVRERDLERERREAAWRAEQERAAEEARRREAVRRRVQALHEDCRDWHEARRLRAYIAAVRARAMHRHGAIAEDSELAAWLRWAAEEADRLDPLTERPSAPSEDRDR